MEDARPDRGRPGLVLQGGHGLHRRRGGARRARRPGPPRSSCRSRSTGPGIARQGNPVVGGGEVTSGTLSPCLGVGHRHGLRARRARRAGHARSRSTCAASCGAAVVATKPLYRTGPRRKESRWPTRATPTTCSTTPSTTGPGSTGDIADLRHHLVRPGRARRGRLLRPARRSARRSTQDESYAEVESVKAVSDVIAPLSGEIVEVNEALGDTPEAINDDPYGEGWMVKVRLSRPVRDASALLDAAAYSRSAGLDEPAGCRAATPPSPTARPARRCSPRSASASIEELFDRQIPDGVRLGRALDLPAGHGRAGRLRAPARAGGAQRLGRGRDLASSAPGCTTTTCRRSIDMLMARSEFLTPYTPYQPEISPGRPAGDVRVPDGDLRADRPAGLERVGLRGPERRRRAPATSRKLANGRPRFVASRRPAPARAARRCARYARGYGAEVVEVPLRDGVTDPDALGRGDRRRHRRGRSSSSRTSSARSRTSRR